MVNLKDNIWIEGGDSYNDINRIDAINGHKHLYSGKTSEIPEKIAKECVHFYFPFDYDYRKLFKDYSYDDDSINNFETAKESIQSACDKEYCIIYKK